MPVDIYKRIALILYYSRIHFGYRYTATPDNIDDIDIGKIFTNNDFVINETLDIGTFSNIGLVINDNLDIGNFFQYRVRWGLLVRLG